MAVKIRELMILNGKKNLENQMINKGLSTRYGVVFEII